MHCSFPDAATCSEICNQPSERVCDLCLYNVQQDPVAGAGGGCHQRRNVGDFMGLTEATSSSPWHKRAMPLWRLLAVLTSVPRFIPDRTPAVLKYCIFFVCAEYIRRIIMKYHINTCSDHSLVIFQGSHLEKSHLMNCHEILKRH